MIRKIGTVIWLAPQRCLAAVIGPGALVTQPIDFRTLLLYYTVAIAITTRPAARRKIRLHESTSVARARPLDISLPPSLSLSPLFLYVTRFYLPPLSRLYISHGNGLTSDVIANGYRWPALLRYRSLPHAVSDGVIRGRNYNTILESEIEGNGEKERRRKRKKE